MSADNVFQACLDRRLNRESDSKEPREWLIRRQHDLDWQALDDLREITRGIVGLDRGESRPGGCGHTEHRAIEIDVIGIDVDAGMLPRLDVLQLDFAVVRF